MPAINPRTNLTLPADLDALISDIARLQNTKKAKFITQILLEAQPALEQMRDALMAVHENKHDALNIVRDYAQNALLETNEQLGLLAHEAKKL